MTVCIRDSCGKQLGPAWAFCPYCGADNRAPELRKEVAKCRHEWVPFAGHCVHCGIAHGQAVAKLAFDLDKPWYRTAKRGYGLVTGGLAALAYSIYYLIVLIFPEDKADAPTRPTILHPVAGQTGWINWALLVAFGVICVLVGNWWTKKTDR